MQEFSNFLNIRTSLHRLVLSLVKFLKLPHFQATVVPLLRDYLQIQRNLVSEKRWSSKGGFIVCTLSAFVQGNSGL